MNYLLDTCAISEFVRPKPDARVVQWMAAQDEMTLHLSALSVGELQRGIAKLADGKRKTFLQNWLAQNVVQRFGERMLPLDTEVCLHWGEMHARLEKQGKPMPAIDGLIAATALRHQLTIVTRNVRDMEPSGVVLFDPWGPET